MFTVALLNIIIYLRSAPSSATPAMRGAGDPAGPRREAGAGPLGPLGATCGGTGEGHGLPGAAVDQAVLGGRSSLTPGPPARPLLAPRSPLARPQLRELPMRPTRSSKIGAGF